MNAAKAESYRIECRTTAPRSVDLFTYMETLRRFSRDSVDPGPATLEDLLVLQPQLDADFLARIHRNDWGVAYYELYAPGCLVRGMTHRLNYISRDGAVVVDADPSLAVWSGSFKVAGEASLASAYAASAWGGCLHDPRSIGGGVDFLLLAPEAPAGRSRLVVHAALRRPLADYLRTVTQSTGMPDLTFEIVAVSDNPLAGDEIRAAAGPGRRDEVRTLYNCFWCGGFFEEAGCACCGRRWPSWHRVKDEQTWLAAPVPVQVYHAVEQATGRKLDLHRTFLLAAQKRGAARRVALALLGELRGRRDALLGKLADPEVARLVAGYLPALDTPLVPPDERQALARRRPPGLGYVPELDQPEGCS